MKRLQLQLAQAEAAARMQVVETEMEARDAEIEALADATGSASKLQTTERAMLRKLRHAEEEVRVAKKPATRANGAKLSTDGAH